MSLQSEVDTKVTGFLKTGVREVPLSGEGCQVGVSLALQDPMFLNVYLYDYSPFLWGLMPKGAIYGADRRQD